MLSSMDFELQSVVPVRHSRTIVKMLQNIPDLMASMAQLDEDSVQRVPKTAEDPPRVSVFDVLQAVTGYPDDQSRGLYRRLLEAYPEACLPFSRVFYAS